MHRVCSPAELRWKPSADDRCPRPRKVFAAGETATVDGPPPRPVCLLSTAPASRRLRVSKCKRLAPPIRSNRPPSAPEKAPAAGETATVGGPPPCSWRMPVADHARFKTAPRFKMQAAGAPDSAQSSTARAGRVHRPFRSIHMPFACLMIPRFPRHVGDSRRDRRGVADSPHPGASRRTGNHNVADYRARPRPVPCLDSRA